MKNMQELEDRIINLEMKLTYQETLIEQLNGVVTKLRDQVDRLEATVQGVSEKVVNAFVSEQAPFDLKPVSALRSS